jgi:hypothetical protein
MNEPFGSQEFMKLLRGLEQRGIPCEIEHQRFTNECNGVVIRISIASEIWEVGFYDNDHIEVLKYGLSGNPQIGATAESILSDRDASN